MTPVAIHADHPYRGQRAVLATKHDKLPLVGPPLSDRLGLDVVEAWVDTDVLGTFSGEVARPGSQRDTAVAKARLGMAASGSWFGLASEGTIGPPPGVPFAVAALEFVVLVDDRAGIVVGEYELGYDIVAVGADVAPGEDMTDLLTRARFPAHGVVVRPAGEATVPVAKGLHDRRMVEEAIRVAARRSARGRVRVETDLRAHHCPSRRPIIARAAGRLADRLAARCGGCGTPGWGVVDVERGVPCGWCGRPVGIPRARVLGCAVCPARERIEVADPARADPGQCNSCNP